ncbi:tail fiber protein [uncultured Mediterranean phage]|nr:tail fiber protein [uncultured Mediterranean phage]
MTILSNKNTPRVSYTASGSQTVFAIPFEFFNVADVKVYNGTTLLTYNASPSTTSQYSITGTASSSDEAYEFGAGGSITLGSTGASASDIITIIRDIAIERTSDFPSVGSFDITALNTQLDQIIAEIADRKQQSDRSIKLADTDSVVADLTLPVKATRASKVLAFDADGDPETTVSSTGLSTLATVTDEIAILGTTAAVADMAILGTTDVVTDMNVLATADVVADMNTLASADFVSDLNTLATSAIVTDMNLLATSANVTAMGLLGTSANVTAMGLLGVSGVITDMGLLGTSAVVTDLDLLGTSANVTAMGLLGVSGVITDMGILGTSANVTAMSTVADNIAGVNSFADRYRVASSDPASSLDAGDLVFNTTSNVLKYYTGSAWSALSTGLTDIVGDTSPQLGGDLSLNGNNIDFPTTANISDCLDEDDMASNSATKLATQQSIKAYADSLSHLSLIDEDNFATNSATRPPSQQSVKAYADTKASTGDATALAVALG